MPEQRLTPAQAPSMSAPLWLHGLSRALRARDTIASVALSHPASCKCLTCRAASGDEDAFAEVFARMEDRS